MGYGMAATTGRRLPSGLQFYGGIVLGCAIPALVYASLVVGFCMWSMAGREA
jgi:hypothetical protein